MPKSTLKDASQYIINRVKKQTVWNRIDSSELDLSVYSQQNSDKGAKTISSTNDAVTTGQLYAKTNQFRHRHYILQKFNLKWVTVLV